MVCPSCQLEHSTRGRFCPACGAAQPSDAPPCAGCSALLPDDVAYCPSCGMRVPRVFCFLCKTPNLSSAKQCVQCSSPLSRSDAVSAGEPARAEAASEPLPPGAARVTGQVTIRIVPEGLVARARLSAAEVSEFEGALRERAAQLATSYHGEWTAEADGSLLLALPRTLEIRDQSSVQAMEVVLRLQASLYQLEERWRSRGLEAIPTRLVVSVGEKISLPGEERALQTSELEGGGAELVGFCPPGKCVVSETVRNEIVQRFRERPVGLMPRAGSGPRGVYLISGRREVPPGAGTPELSRLPFVGREREFSLLRRRWTEVSRGKGSRLCTVVGSPGSGRSRLMDAFVSALKLRGGHFACAVCEPQTRCSPLAPIRVLLKQLIGVQPDDDRATLELRLRVAAQRALEGEGRSSTSDAPEVTELCVLLGEVLDAELEAGAMVFNPSFLSPAGLKMRVFHAVQRFLSGLSRETPRALVIEDLHLADAATLDLVRFLASSLRSDARILLVCTALPEFLQRQTGWEESWAAHEVIRLGRVGREELEPLIRAILATPQVPPRLVGDIVEAAQGRPSVAELFARAWLELQLHRSESGAELEPSIEGLIKAAYSVTPVLGTESGDEESDEAGIGETTASDMPVSLLYGPNGSSGGSLGGPLRPPPRPARSEAGTGGPDWPDDEPLVIEEGDRDDGTGDEATVVVPIPAAGEDSRPTGARIAGLPRVRTSHPGPVARAESVRDGVVARLWRYRVARVLRMARRVLQLGAVQGGTFRSDLLRSQWKLDEQPTEALGPLLQELNRLGFITRCVDALATGFSWRFCGGGILEAVYESLPGDERRSLHRTVARLLEEGSSERILSADYAAVAHHYEAGEDLDRALRYLVMAARQARRFQADEEAQRLADRALAHMREVGFSDRTQEQISLRITYGRLLVDMRAYARALRELERAVEFARVARQPRLEAEALLAMCEALAGQDTHVDALKRAVAARDLAETLGHPWLTVQSLHWVGFEHLTQGRLSEAEQTLKLALKIASERGTAMMAVRARQVLALFDHLRGQHEQSSRGHAQLVEQLRRGAAPGGPSSH